MCGCIPVTCGGVRAAWWGQGVQRAQPPTRFFEFQSSLHDEYTLRRRRLPRRSARAGWRSGCAGRPRVVSCPCGGMSRPWAVRGGGTCWWWWPSTPLSSGDEGSISPFTAWLPGQVRRVRGAESGLPPQAASVRFAGRSPRCVGTSHNRPGAHRVRLTAARGREAPGRAAPRG